MNNTIDCTGINLPYKFSDSHAEVFLTLIILSVVYVILDSKFLTKITFLVFVFIIDLLLRDNMLY